MGVNGRSKGAGFERTVAKLILEAAGKPFGKKDCYRTPMSGGHPFAGESDLVISKKLQRLFPFCVECKFYKNWEPAMLLSGTGGTMKWVEQVTFSAKKDKFKRQPLLVIKANRRPIMAATRFYSITDWDSAMSFSNVPSLVFTAPNGQRWRLFLFSEMLKRLKVKARKNRRS